MRQPSRPDDRSVTPPSPPRPPPSWRSAVGNCSLSSGTEVVYDSPEEYEEDDPPAPSPSPETKKRRDAEFERTSLKLLRRVTNTILGKTQEQLDALIAKYHRDVKTSRMEANRRNMLEVINAACPVCHVHVSSNCRSYREASQAEQRDAGQRWQMMERARGSDVESTVISFPQTHLRSCQHVCSLRCSGNR